MAETGEGAPKNELQNAIVERNGAMAEDSAGLAERLLGRADEATAARFLNMHEEINMIARGLQLRDPKEIAGFMATMHRGIKELTVGTRTDFEAGQAYERQLELSKDGSASRLADGIKSTIKSVGGTVGPTGDMFVRETSLK